MPLPSLLGEAVKPDFSHQLWAWLPQLHRPPEAMAAVTVVRGQAPEQLWRHLSTLLSAPQESTRQVDQSLQGGGPLSTALSSRISFFMMDSTSKTGPFPMQLLSYLDLMDLKLT